MAQVPLVSIVMITYSHEEFIYNAIESVLSQKCKFNFELIIANDCSPDQTDNVIKSILDTHPSSNRIKYIRHEKNIGMMQNFLFALQQAKGIYIALCEGDDYWIDQYKLQKQIDLLDSNKDYSICWTDYKVLRDDSFENNEWEKVLNLDSNKLITLDNFGYPYCTYTLTACFRKEVLNGLNNLNFKHFKDNTLYVMALCKGDGVLMNIKTAVYRKHNKSVYSSSSLLLQSFDNFLNISEILILFNKTRNYHFINYFNFTKSELKKNIIRFSTLHFQINFLICRFYFSLLIRDFYFFIRLLK